MSMKVTDILFRAKVLTPEYQLNDLIRSLNRLGISYNLHMNMGSFSPLALAECLFSLTGIQ